MSTLSTLIPYDVCICGAGLAGLSLARQLKLVMPELRIAVLDRQRRPLPPGAHKVGESSIEAGTHYLMHTLELHDYVDRVHKYKSGLRFFTRSGQLPLEQRTESGSPDFPGIPTIQIDRGVLENDLRQMCVDMGIELAEGVGVCDVQFGAAGNMHEITAVDPREDLTLRLRARWVVDAMGRTRFLAKKLGLTREVAHKASACWWRLPGKWDITHAVTAPAEQSDWRQRELGPRWYSTNHFMGHGYWVWVIPVASHTSIGIVTDESIHPLSARASIGKATEWLRVHEPHLARWMQDAAPADFLGLKNFAYGATRCYSEQRWACVGEAAMFADPYYSTGTDLIALQNNIVTRMIRMDRGGRLTARIVSDYNDLIAEFYRGILALYTGQYPIFGNEYVHYHKTMWDYDYITGAMGKLGFAPHVLDEVDLLPEITATLRQWSELNIRVQAMLRDWARAAPGKSIDRSETAAEHIGRGMLVPNLQIFQTFSDQLKIRDARGLIASCSGNLLDFVQARAVWLFKKAARDLRPSASVPESLLDKAANAAWLNPQALSLDPMRWEKEQLFEPARMHVIDKAQMDYMVPTAPLREAIVTGTPRAHELIWNNIKEQPERVAVKTREGDVSYGELGALVANATNNLLAKCRSEGGTVVTLGDSNIHTLAVFLGALNLEMAFVAAPSGADWSLVLSDLAPTLVVINGEARPAGTWNTAPLSDLVRGSRSPMPAVPAPTLVNRLAKCYGRYKGGARGNPKLHWITHYSLMNYYTYTELALRPFIALSSSAASYPPLAVCPAGVCGYDWLLPLIFGGTLVIDSAVSGLAALRQLEMTAAALGATPVLSGTPQELLMVSCESTRLERVILLALDAALSASEAASLTKRAPAVVDSGVLIWGHESLWPDEIRGHGASAQRRSVEREVIVDRVLSEG